MEPHTKTLARPAGIGWIRAAVFGALSLTLAACATVGRIEDSKADGVAVVYDVPPSRAQRAALSVLRKAAADPIHERWERGYVIGQLGITMVCWGTTVCVWVEPHDPSGSRVTVVSRRAVSMNLFTRMTEENFHVQFAEELGARDGDRGSGVAASPEPRGALLGQRGYS